MKFGTSGSGGDSRGWKDGHELSCRTVGDQKNVSSVWLSPSSDGLV